MVTRKKESSQSRKISNFASLPRPAHSIAALGDKAATLIETYYKENENSPLFEIDHEESLSKLAKAFGDQWKDEEVTKVLKQFLASTDAGQKIDIVALSRWVLSHPNDSRAVFDCMDIQPPQGIYIIKVLSRAGSQKLVFLATWRIEQKQVVLKKLIGPPDVTDKIMARELQPHPLSMKHPNIIKTHLLMSKKGEPFLVEERLPFVLNDAWRAEGIQEAANLFFDIAKALQFLHSMDLVHGDVKPDNIGKDSKDYILLDFGICRKKEAFIIDASATGSLRTRSPELLEADRYMEYPEKVDVWALGATIYNTMVGRFPLFDEGESPPRVSSPAERMEAEKYLLKRVQEEWDARVDLSVIPDPLRKLLERTLTKDPKDRISAAEIVSIASTELAAFLRSTQRIGKFSPIEELQQYMKYLPDKDMASLMPRAQRDSLKSQLETLKTAQGLETAQRGHVDKLLSALSEKTLNAKI